MSNTNPFASQDAAEARTTDTYLNVSIQVAEDVVVSMPLNCPVSNDIKGMNANQRKLMELLLAKVEHALTLPEGEERDEALTIQVPVTLKLFRKGSKEADAGSWSL